MYILWISKEHVNFLFISNELIDTKSTATPLNFDIQTIKKKKQNKYHEI